jgi:hypothetical protein
MRAKERALPPARRSEVVAEIVELLVPQGDDSDKFTAEFMVVSAIQFIDGLPKKPVWGFKESNSKSLSALSKSIRDLRKTLAKTPAEILILLAGADLSEQWPLMREQQMAIDRLKRGVAVLGYMQRRCDELQTQKVGGHRGADSMQRLIAEEAWRLMKYHALTPASGISESTFGMISSLLFEALTGEANKDLQRHCKSALERAKKGELNEWRG